MEFERSLFRVYEKIVSSAGSNYGASPAQQDRTVGGRSRFSAMLWAMRACLCVSALSLASVIALHSSFAGDGACLREALSRAGLEPKIYDLAVFTNLTGDGSKLLSDSIVRIWVFDEDEDIAPGDVDLSSMSTPMIDVTSSSSGEVDSTNSLTDRIKPHYEFSADPAFLLIDEHLRPAHLVREWNVTFSPSCYGVWTKYYMLRRLLKWNLDDVVVNQLMHGLDESEGVLRNLETHETWSWSSERLSSRDASPFQRIMSNLTVLWRVLVLFAFVSSMTALMVRTLISSGVAIMFPIMGALLRFNLVPAEVVRLLTLSYPWIGGDVEVLQSTGQTSAPLIRAHLFNVVLTYAAYEACQFAWRRFFLGFKPQPAGLEVVIFAFIMVCEYYLLIFARAARTLRYLPKLMAISFILFLQYSFASPYGFTTAAAVLLWSWTLFWMIWFVDKCEVKALRRGIVSVEAPRAFYTLLASPQWPMSLPPHWSTFHELNRVQRSIYEQDFSALDDEGTDEDVEQGRSVGAVRQGRRTSVVPSEERHSAEVAAGPALPDSRLAHRRSRRENTPLVMNPPTVLSSPGPTSVIGQQQPTSGEGNNPGSSRTQEDSD